MNCTYLNFKPTKGQAFRLYFSMSNNDGAFQSLTSGMTYTISKDGAAFNAPTNTVVQIAQGKGYLDLTASEMTADCIIVSMDQTSINGDQGIIIYTESGSGAGLSLTNEVTDITSLSDDNPTVNEVLSFLWQYFRKRRKRAGWSLTKHIASG